MSGFLMMLTQNGKLLYISDNAAEYLGHSMVSIELSFSHIFVVHFHSFRMADKTVEKVRNTQLSIALIVMNTFKSHTE